MRRNAAGCPVKETRPMKTIMMAAAAALMLTPAAHAAVSVAGDVASMAICDGQVKGATMEMAGGPSRTGAISAPGGKGSLPGKSTFGANDTDSGKQVEGKTVRIAAGLNKLGKPSSASDGRGSASGKSARD